MSFREESDSFLIEVPGFPSPVKVRKSDVVEIKEEMPPGDLCRLVEELHSKGVIVAGSTLDGKVTFYKVKNGKKCIKLTLRDGRVMYVGKD